MKEIVVRLIDDQHAEYKFPGSPPETQKLVRDSLFSETLMWFSWYLENVDEQQCSNSLLKLIGRHLSLVLFPDDKIRDKFVTFCRMKEPLRVRLDFDPAAEALARLPWEFICVDAPGGGDMEFLASRSDLMLVRHIGMQECFERGGRALKVLLVVQSPPDQPTIQTRQLTRQLRELEKKKGTGFVLRAETNLDWSGVRKAIREFKPDVFHFAGHGATGVVWLARAAENTSSPQEAALGFESFRRRPAIKVNESGVAVLFADYTPRLVVLDACESAGETEVLPSVAHAILRQGVQAVVAMRYKISNPAAEKFNAELYQRIASGERLDVAVQMARRELGMLRIGENDDTVAFGDRAFGTPVLYLDRSEAVCDPLPDVVVRSVGAVPSTTSGRQIEAEQVTCPSCHKPRTSLFCPACGCQLRCKTCRAVIDYTIADTVAFCNDCGESLAKPRAPAIQTATGPRDAAA